MLIAAPTKEIGSIIALNRLRVTANASSASGVISQKNENQAKSTGRHRYCQI